MKSGKYSIGKAMVVGSNFLCHMAPVDAKKCLRNITRLVGPGGHLFVSGVDVDVRTKLALDLGWTPMRELLADIHDGDPSIQPAQGHKIYPSPAQRGDRTRQSCGGRRHHLCSDRPRLFLSRGDHRASRAVLAWRRSNTIDVSFCLAALEEAFANIGKPEIFNPDQGSHQGSQFTSAAFTGALAAQGVAISPDRRGRWMDNVFIERLWRSLKHGFEARLGIFVDGIYNERRLHQALGYRPPMVVWREERARAVDMMDNAFALPTCPQKQLADTAFGRMIEGTRAAELPTKKPAQDQIISLRKFTGLTTASSKIFK